MLSFSSSVELVCLVAIPYFSVFSCVYRRRSSKVGVFIFSAHACHFFLVCVVSFPFFFVLPCVLVIQFNRLKN